MKILMNKYKSLELLKTTQTAWTLTKINNIRLPLNKDEVTSMIGIPKLSMFRDDFAEFTKSVKSNINSYINNVKSDRSTNDILPNGISVVDPPVIDVQETFSTDMVKHRNNHACIIIFIVLFIISVGLLFMILCNKSHKKYNEIIIIESDNDGK